MRPSAPLAVLFGAFCAAGTVLASTVAQAADPAPADAPPSDMPDDIVPADVPVAVLITSLTTSKPLPADGLALSACAVPYGNAERGSATGSLVFELRVRRGKASVVSLASAEPGVAAFGPCFERELAAWRWPVKRDDVRVTVQIGDPPPAEAAAP